MAIHVVTGVGSDGRSTVISTTEKSFLPASAAGWEIDEFLIHGTKDAPETPFMKLFEAAEPRISRPATDHLLPLPLVPGGIQWLQTRFDEPISYPLHRTDSLDLNVVLSGAIELTLETGGVRLSAGDSVVIPGVLHGWRCVTPGTTVAVVLIGLDPA